MSKDAALDGSGDFRDRSLAVAISVTLHLVTFGWAWSLGGQEGRGETEVPGSSDGTGIEADFLASNQFRQRIEIMPALASSKISSASESPPENAPDVTLEPAVDPPNSPDSISTDVFHAPTATATKESAVATYKSMGAGTNQGGENAGGNNDDGLRAAYLAALRVAIRQHWNHQGPLHQCSLTIKQSPGGLVRSAVAGECSLSTEDRRALEAAVLMAQPMPYVGFETEYLDSLVLDIAQH